MSEEESKQVNKNFRQKSGFLWLSFETGLKFDAFFEEFVRLDDWYAMENAYSDRTENDQQYQYIIHSNNSSRPDTQKNWRRLLACLLEKEAYGPYVTLQITL